MRLLLFGKNGQVAHCIRDEGLRDAAGSNELAALGSAECDLLRQGAGAEAIGAHSPDIVVNAAGYTAVDRAETEIDAARRLNTDAPAELAGAARRNGARFIQLSTDYVFDGFGDHYDENAETNPLNQYGRTKRDGEIAVLTAAPDAIILRTSWVFSEYGTNFLKTMLHLAADRKELSIVGDQIGGPTPARDIARAVLTMAAKIHRGADGAGIYHYQGRPTLSWAAFAKAIFEAAGREIEIREIATADYPTAAQRPLRTVLDCARIERDFGLAPPDWRTELPRILVALETPRQTD